MDWGVSRTVSRSYREGRGDRASTEMARTVARFQQKIHKTIMYKDMYGRMQHRGHPLFYCAAFVVTKCKFLTDVSPATPINPRMTLLGNYRTYLFFDRC